MRKNVRQTGGKNTGFLSIFPCNLEQILTKNRGTYNTLYLTKVEM